MFTEVLRKHRPDTSPTHPRRMIFRRRRKRRIRPRHRLPGLLPTLLTLSNGICGLGSIVIATGTLAELSVTKAGLFSALLIFLGMLFDMLDGQVARRLKQTSAFGAQLDSLCDAVTFGAAPVFVLLTFGEVYHPRFLFGIGVVYMACVLLRLARFNVETPEDDSHEFFTGLPSPAAAGTVASFALARPGLENWAHTSMSVPIQYVGSAMITGIMVVVPLLTLLLSWLMVSRISYRHIANRWMQRRYGFYQLSRTVLIIIAALVVNELAVPLVFCLFALESPCVALWKTARSRDDQPDSDPGLSESDIHGEVRQPNDVLHDVSREQF